jgi:hypothetical protein
LEYIEVFLEEGWRRNVRQGVNWKGESKEWGVGGEERRGMRKKVGGRK